MICARGVEGDDGLLTPIVEVRFGLESDYAVKSGLVGIRFCVTIRARPSRHRYLQAPMREPLSTHLDKVIVDHRR
jgi:hypothetical protein